MKTRSKPGRRRFPLQLLAYGNFYYTERVAQLETALARKPRSLQIDLIGAGEMPADPALLIRSALLGRSPKTQLITNARSSLHGSSVLVWLLGDQRLIRDDARLYFRRLDLSQIEPADQPGNSKKDEATYRDSFCEIDPEEGDYARVLQLINEYLPVKELAGRFIEVPVLRQFGLIENEKVDHFLATAFARERQRDKGPLVRPEEKQLRSETGVRRSRPVKR